MMRAFAAASATLVLALLAGCQTQPGRSDSSAATAQPAVETGPRESGARIVHVASNGWHTGIVLARSDLASADIPEIGDFPGARYFEFSWGDARYFPAAEKGVGLALRAMLVPTAAVVHVAGLPAHPRETFPQAEIISLELKEEQLSSLLRYLNESFDRGRGGAGTPGLYPFSRFYPASGRFHLFNTCNTWTARGLAEAGVPLKVTGTVRAEDLMSQLR